MIYHENKEQFRNDQRTMDNDEFKFAMSEYKEYLKYAENKGAKVINGVNITINLLKQELQDGNLVILAGQVIGGYHAVLLTGYDEYGFKVCDTLYKTKQNRTFNEIENFMNTGIGKWFISVNDKIRKQEQ